MRIYYPGKAPVSETNAATFRPEQITAIKKMIAEVTEPGKSKAVLCGAGMGSGKTAVTVEVILKTNPKRCLIVGPKDAFPQWQKVLIEQTPASEPIRPMLRIDSTIAGKAHLAKLLKGDEGLFYVGLEMLRAQDWEMVPGKSYPTSEYTQWLLGPRAPKYIGEAPVVAKQKNTYSKMKKVDLLISDESHRHSNQKSASIKTMRDIPAVAKIALSGTFFGNRFENAWVMATWLWGKEFAGSKIIFEILYCTKEPIMTKDGRKQITSPSGHPLSKVVSEKDPGKYVKTLPCYVFIPTPVGAVPKSEIVKVKLSTEQQRQYDEMASQSLTWIQTKFGTKHEPLVADLPIVQRLRLRTAALGAMTLIPALDEEGTDSITFSPDCDSTTLNIAYKVLHRPEWVGQKVLILTHSKQFANEAARRIGKKYRVALKTGDVTSKEWEADKASFMRPVSETDSVQYLVAVISAVGTAMDGLQANCSKVLWLSEDENNVNNIQASNRIWRDGFTRADYESVKIVQMGTIAEGVLAKNNAHKIRTLDSIQGIK